MATFPSQRNKQQLHVHQATIAMVTTELPSAVHLQEKDHASVEDLSHDVNDERAFSDLKSANASTNGYRAHEDANDDSWESDSLYNELLDDVQPFKYAEGMSRVRVSCECFLTSRRTQCMRASGSQSIQRKTS